MINRKKQWKDIINYEKIYQISNLGRIKRIAGGPGTYAPRILRPQINRFGYLQITLCKNGQRKTQKLHRLTLESFSGPCPPKMECRHLDGNRQNNKLNNLRWGTKSENAKDAIQHGTFSGLQICGLTHRMSKLTNTKVELILQLLKSGRNGNAGKKWLQREIAALFNIDQSTVSYISTRKIWKHI